MGRLLDRYNAMQSRPLGTNTMLNDGSQYGAGGAAGSQYRRQGAAYGQALRILNRQARRGDARSALAAIDTRRDAMNEGFMPGGIRNRAQGEADVMDNVTSMNRDAQTLETARGDTRQYGREQMAPVNPNATVGVGRGSRILDRGAITTMEARSPAATNQFTPGANVTNPADGFQNVGAEPPAPTAVAPRIGMIDGRPASEVLAEMRAPKAKPVDPVEDYLASVEGYQAGLNGEGDPAAADARATATYMKASDLDKARMSSALMKRAAELNKKQSRILKRR